MNDLNAFPVMNASSPQIDTAAARGVTLRRGPRPVPIRARFGSGQEDRS